MNSVNWSYETLNALLCEAFSRFGFEENESRLIADVLLLSDLYGIESHGMQRLILYHKGIEKGKIHPEAKPEIVFETPVSAVVDGHAGMGQLNAAFAMKLAIQKAKTGGVGIVTVRDSNHFGIAGYYARMACDEGLVGIACTNSKALMVPTFARQALLGSNPVAVAAPADPYPFLFDASTTVVTRGKLEMYNKTGEALPSGWAVDEAGRETDSAPRVLENLTKEAGGGILPLGGSSMTTGSHKGYGWGMVCELFSSILSLGMTSNHCCTAERTAEGRTGICHGFAAVNPAFFGDPAAIREHLSAFLEELRRAPKADGQDRIYTHGEKEIAAMERRRAEGIPVNPNTMWEISNLCKDLGMDFARYFGNYVPVKPEGMFTGIY